MVYHADLIFSPVLHLSLNVFVDCILEFMLVGCDRYMYVTLIQCIMSPKTSFFQFMHVFNYCFYETKELYFPIKLTTY